MIDVFSLFIGCLSFFVINILGDVIMIFDSFLNRKRNVGMTQVQISRFRKYIKDCYGLSYSKFCLLDAEKQVSILSSFFGIDAHEH